MFSFYTLETKYLNTIIVFYAVVSPFDVELAFNSIRDFCTVNPIELVVRKQFIKFHEMYIRFCVKVASPIDCICEWIFKRGIVINITFEC